MNQNHVFLPDLEPATPEAQFKKVLSESLKNKTDGVLPKMWKETNVKAEEERRKENQRRKEAEELAKRRVQFAQD